MWSDTSVVANSSFRRYVSDLSKFYKWPRANLKSWGGMFLLTFLSFMLIFTVCDRSALAKTKLGFAITLDSNDIIYDSKRDVIYASVPSYSKQLSNTITVLNPNNGQFGISIPVGNNPTKLALSDDNHFLYAIVDNSKVSRIDLNTNQVVLTVDIDLKSATNPKEPIILFAIAVLPGQTDSFVVSANLVNTSESVGLAVYDNNVRRPITSKSFITPITLSFGPNAGILYAMNHDGSSVSRYKIDQQGIVSDKISGVSGYYFNLPNGQFIYSKGLIYTNNGQVFDPETGIINGTCFSFETSIANAFALDVEENKIYFATRNDFEFTLTGFDLNTYRLIGYYSKSNTVNPRELDVDEAWKLLRCGKAGLAVMSHSRIIPSTIIIFPLATLKPLTPYKAPQPIPLNNAVRKIALPNYGFTYDDNTRQFYASIPGVIPSIGNSIVSIDPFQGKVGKAVFVGSEPLPPVVSDKGKYLYVGLFGQCTINRLLLPDLSSNLINPIFYDGPFSQTAAPISQILPLPNQPESVVLLRGASSVVVYDNNNKRPGIVDHGSFYSNAPEPIDTIQLSPLSDKIYGLNSEDTDFTFSRLMLTDQGVRPLDFKSHIGSRFGANLVCQSGLCFDDRGTIVDPENVKVLGYFNLQPHDADIFHVINVLPDVAEERVYFLTSEVNNGVSISAYDLKSLQRVSFIRIPGVDKEIGNFLMWNNDQLAFSNFEGIITLPKSLVDSAPTITRVSFSNSQLEITGTNLGSSDIQFAINLQKIKKKVISQSDTTIILSGDMPKFKLVSGDNFISISINGTTIDNFVFRVSGR